MRERINTALEKAVAEDNKRCVSTLRLIRATIRDRDEAARGSGGDRVSDDGIAVILVKMIKQRVESSRDYEESGQLGLAQQERDEISIIDRFLPEQLDDEQVRSVCADAIALTGSAGLRDVGKCMQQLKNHYRGRMNFGKASAVVRAMLR